ncbi:hypothetical protein HJC23_006555 [Cyclotella cryptica]|uniref:F-box domain-containing protein n=1 Tax=Cyclotella cryptica TaxID=29204 RepID=A0ABD3PKI6_9STRA|eukprot:CCRYP_013630-RA/>CCRYP_013630-RA protein AED:0.17 eAED:0.17 QI:1306/1/1/1/1/1/3/1104/206
MATIHDLAPEIMGKIYAYALNVTVLQNDNAKKSKSLIDSLLTFELVSKEWKSTIQSEASTEAWAIVCQTRFPGTSASTRSHYKFFLSTIAQSAARVIQRFFCKTMCDKQTWWRVPLDAPFSPFSMTPCCVCGVRFDLRMLNTCWIPRCSRMFSICSSCEAKYPNRAMGKAVGLITRVPACFGCKDEGSLCPRKERGALMVMAFTAQ